MKNLFFLLCFGCMSAFSQAPFSITGVVADANGQTLPFASVQIVSARDSATISASQTNTEGKFIVVTYSINSCLLKITYIGYDVFYKELLLKDQSFVDVGKIVLLPSSNTLNEVVIKADKQPIELKKDTLEFDATILKSQANENLEDLIRKVPTLEIDENGALKTQNKTIRKVLVDGKEFFGNDPTIALKNLPADAIDKVQVIEKKTDAAEFSGIDDGEREIVINVSLKPKHKKGTIGFVSAGAFPKTTEGNTPYNLKTSVNRFSSKNQFSVIGFQNNLNQQGFTQQDATNFANLNKTPNRGSSSSTQNTSVNLPIAIGKRPGFITSTGAGLNYNNQFSKNSSIQSSYFYNRGYTTLIRDLDRKSFFTNKEVFTIQHILQNRTNDNHRLNMTLNYDFNKKNTIKIISNFNSVAGSASSESQTDITNKYLQRQTSNNSNRSVSNQSNGFSYNNNLLFRHRFSKPRRITTINFIQSFNKDFNSDSTHTTNVYSSNGIIQTKEIFQLNDRQTSQNSNRVQFTYTEPFSKRLSLEGNYAYQYNFNRSNFEVFDILQGKLTENQILSNNFKNEFVFQQAGIKLNNDMKEKTWVVAAFYQNSVLKSYLKRGTDNFLRKEFENFLPMARYSFRKSNLKNTSIEYNTSVNEPSVRDLQPITISNNPQNIFIGNPDLRPEYNHKINLNQNFFKPSSFQTINFSGNLTFVSNAIVYSQVVNENLSRTTTPINAASRWVSNVNLNYTFSPNKKQKNKLKIMLSPKWMYSKKMNSINGIENLTTQNQITSAFRVTYLTDKLNIIVNNSLQNSYVSYSVNKEFNQKIAIFRHTSDLKWRISKRSSINTEFDYTYYQSQRFSGIQNSIPIINFAYKQLFLKDNRAEIAVSCNDLLNKNIYIFQRTDDNFFEIETSNTLKRYFLLSLTYNLKKM